MTPVLLIPIYEPSQITVRFMQELERQISVPIVIVDDGSGGAYDSVFQTILDGSDHITFLSYPTNQGKGHALKHGMAYICRHFPDCSAIVTADGDGQHGIEDIRRMLTRASVMPPHTLLLGVRAFDRASTPFKSYWGNTITSLVFLATTGTMLHDTQTGLRGFRRQDCDWMLTVAGDRFEYEMNVLLALKEAGIGIETMPIQTIYIENNGTSHFRPIRDSLRIYGPLLRFAASSTTSAFVDISLFMVLSLFLGRSAYALLAATVTSRCTSGLVNYHLNNAYVFGSARSRSQTFWRYGMLFSAQMIVSWIGVSLLSQLIPSLLVTKMVVDTTLFFISYNIQRNYIFTQRRSVA